MAVTAAASHLATNHLVIIHGKQPELSMDGACIVNADSIGLEPDCNDPHMRSFFGELVAGYDRVLIDSPADQHQAWAQYLRGAHINGELVVANANDVDGAAPGDAVCTSPVACPPLGLAERAQKRALDLVIGLVVLIFLAPLLLLVALAIRLESRGPALFCQDRIGRGNRVFRMLKFRSMRSEACDPLGTRSTQREDDRVTRVGRFIRATSIDELPQLLNVLKGDMSIVGPRPHALGSTAENQLFWQIDERYWLRHQFKPGLTGLAQVRGYRGATTTRRDLIDRLESDLEYIDDWSLGRDLAILVGTLRVLVHPNSY